MKIRMKKMIFTKGILVLLCVSVVLLAGVQKVSAAEQKKLPYLIKVNRVHNTITIYEQDKNGKYSVPIKAMVCSVGAKGTQTRLGTFQTKAKYRWKELMGDVWGQYSTRIVGGILFHSVYYYENGNPATLATKEFNKLGTAASHGCIRLSVGDAKWIYDNCAIGTTVIVYDDKNSPGPLGKPETIKIPATVRWDPTDPSNDNPYKQKKPQITGAKNITVDWGEERNLRKGVKAKSTLGTDITSKIVVKGKVDYYKPGDYKVTYTVTDALGRTGKKSITVTVGECEIIPEFTGIIDRIVGEGITIDEEFALEGVEAYCADVKLDSEDIEVTIEQINEEEYYITYRISLSEKATATETAKVYIDREAPVISGVTDLILPYGVELTEAFALSAVTITDNFTLPEDILISVSFIENEDGSYLVSYEATDEVGNLATEQALIHN